ncbi:hypothetical protein [Salegentibacter sp. UBA1130]|uniref:hypothetical protein n=1 Tax=Salegentibacter sp. UBA1130 TaxID=1947451 RepID=UPI00257AF785|nr:hypothetical protein [Salegentibacter sp. UBA1130]
MILTEKQIEKNLVAYKALSYPEFISNYEIVFVEYCESHAEIPPAPFSTTNEYVLDNTEYPSINYSDLEINFIKDLNAYRIKRLRIMMSYFAHVQKTEKYPENFFYRKVHEEITNAKLKYHFLSKKMYSLDSSIKLQQSLDQIESKEILDLRSANGREKIIYLQELGILDFLLSKQPFKSSTNSLATALSALTGEDVGTLQSYLNPIINSGVGQKNNPLKSIKKVEKVKQALINIGYKVN